jgi:tetratricopeptide (TPR) repeat protein
LCALPLASVEDCAWLGRIAEVVHDYPTATEAWKKAVDLSPQKERLSVVGGYADALLLAGQPATVISDLVPLLAGIRKGDYPKRIGPDFAIAVATAYLRTGDLAKADEWHKDIVSWKGASNLEGLAGFSQELRLAQGRSRLTATPNDAQARLDYGRVLMDVGHWGEAVDEISQALTLNPGLRTARWDMAYALLHIQGADQRVQENFEAALAEAEHDSQPDAKTRSKDLFVWHRLGLLLYRNAWRQQGVSDPQAADTLVKSKVALAEALKLARFTKKTDSYNAWWGYTGPQVRATAGWEYPEAESDFAFLAGLQAVTDHPGDYLAHFRVASALVELGQADLAEAAIQRTAQLQPGFVEVKYAAARLALRNGDTERAQRLLQELLQSNPRHPQANLDLARLYTEDGDMPAAAACLAKHAQCYGTP